jgi:DNA-binding FadR family transcriptional regulator
MSGSSVHLSLAGETGLRIMRGGYPPGTILPNEAKWTETCDAGSRRAR